MAKSTILYPATQLINLRNIKTYAEKNCRCRESNLDHLSPEATVLRCFALASYFDISQSVIDLNWDLLLEEKKRFQVLLALYWST